MPKLTIQRNDIDHWVDLKDEEYVLITDQDGNKVGLAFKCPGCNEPLAINNQHDLDHPKWTIDFDTFTASPSILHSRDGRGCGWHGYLRGGELVVA